MIPGSPEDIRLPVPPSGVVSPFPGLGAPAMGSNTPTDPASSIPFKPVRIVKEEHPLSKD